MKNGELFSFENTIAHSLCEAVEYPFEIPELMPEAIARIGRGLDKERFYQLGRDVWIAKSARVDKSAVILGPAIIDEYAEIRTGAYIRGGVIIGRGAVVGNSSEVKNAILLEGAQIPHFNYVGDSILGNRAHLGAGAICSNLKSDKSSVVIHAKSNIDTGLRKLGAILGDGAEIGCGCVLNPGTIVGKGCAVYPLTSLCGIYPPNSIVKSKNNIVERE